VLDVKAVKPQEVDPEKLQEYDLVGFGSGIYDAILHTSISDLVGKLPQVGGKNAFYSQSAEFPQSIDIKRNL
jgi:hypothetical protein